MVKSITPTNSVFGRRLREARLRVGIAQDKLGVRIGIDEGCSSARMSRYESGTHEPPFTVAERIAEELGLSVTYFYCRDDRLAEIIRIYASLPENKRNTLLHFLTNL